MRRTKIVATVGPASSEPAILCQLIQAGVDVFRLNFSHGRREEHRGTIRAIRDACAETGRDVAILQDLCGPKIRVGEMENGAVELADDSEVRIQTKTILGTPTDFSTTYKALPRDAKSGGTILLDDGRLALEVLSTTDTSVTCRVVHGGVLKSHKGMNLPGMPISAPSVTQKDVKDLVIGLEEEVDFVALSFVRHPDDIRRVRRTLEKHEKTTQIIAKIEKPEAIECIDEIVYAADGIMVARGDLGVEMSLEEVPLIQKDLIHRANEADKYVITATQMLESMVEDPTPTRAEVADVANAILDGTDALMLSGETAVGAHPVRVVAMMDKIARTTEAFLASGPRNWNWDRLNPTHPVQDAIGHAVYRLYDDLNVQAIAAFSSSGGTGLFLSKSRPFAPILVFTPRREAFRRMRLFWGVEPILDASIHTKEELRAKALDALRARASLPAGSRILVVSGSHFGQVGATNSIEIATVEDNTSGKAGTKAAQTSKANST